MYGKWLDRGSNEGKATRPGADNARGGASMDGVVTALATGALLGAVAAMPYDQLLGISDSACTILRSVVTTVMWAGLSSERLQDLIFDAGALHMRVPHRRQVKETQIRRVGDTRKGNQHRVHNVLKVRAGSILAHHGG
jgi:hypothetical protein